MKVSEQGHFTVTASASRVLSFMTDPEFLGKTLPDSKGYRVTGPDTCVVDMRVGVSHIRGAMPATLTVQPFLPDDPLVVKVSAQGLGSRVDMRLQFDVHEAEGRTEIDWLSDAMVSGVLASVGAGLLRPLAKRNFDAIVEAIQGAIEAAV